MANGGGGALALGVRLGEMMGVSGFAAAQDRRQHCRAALLGVRGALQNQNAIAFTKLHTLAAFAEGAKRTVGDEAKAVEPAEGVFADRVVSAGDHQIELGGLK